MGQDSPKVLRGKGFPVRVSTAMPLTDRMRWTHPCMPLRPQTGIEPADISFDYEHLSCPHAERDDCDGIDRKSLETAPRVLVPAAGARPAVLASRRMASWATKSA